MEGKQDTKGKATPQTPEISKANGSER